MATSLGVANLANTMLYKDAPDNLKCMWFAMADLEGGTKDSIYEANKKLLSAERNWDDTSMGTALAHRYGYYLVPAIRRWDDVEGRYNVPGTKLFVLHELGGLPLPSGKGKPFSKDDIKNIIKNPSIGLHAVSGIVNSQGKTEWKEFGKPLYSVVASRRCIVFMKDAPK